jgi:molybdopterin-synthase adenylyltransferase
MKNSIVSTKSVKYQCKPILPTVEGEADAQERFKRVPGTDLKAAGECRITVIGCGGLGSRAAPILTRKGYGIIQILDFDVVALANLGTQNFHKDDLYENKAFATARKLVQEATAATLIEAHPLSFQDALAQGVIDKPDVLLILVDNNRTRIDGARKGLEWNIPIVFAGVGRDGTHGTVSLQEPDKACFGCFFPDAVEGAGAPCPGVPTCIDILQILAAHVAYAVDSIVMQRPRRWNYRTCELSGIVSDSASMIERNPKCPLCGNSDKES